MNKQEYERAELEVVLFDDEIATDVLLASGPDEGNEF